MHYVWRRYLKAWAIDDQIWCCRDKKIFRTNLKNVGQQRDFYKPKDLTVEDIQAIHKLAIEPISSNELKQANIYWINVFEFKSKIQRIVDEQPADQEVIRQLNVDLHNFEEDFQSRLENIGKPYLDSIIQESLGFFETEKGCFDFLIFMCFQYFRTKKLYDSVVSNCKNSAREIIDIEKTWGVLRHIYRTNVVNSIFGERNSWKLTLLRNQSNIPFITCDQPVINTYAYGKSLESTIEELKLYYPISPSLAVLLTKIDSYTCDVLDVDNLEVDGYNALVVDASHEQIYSNQEQVLKDLLPFV